MTYEIGKSYMVPCVLTTKENRIGRGKYVPVIGPKHEDAEFIGFPYQHWHVDWRFISKEILDVSSAIGSSLLAQIVHANYAGGDIVKRKMMCKREMPKYPTNLEKIKWIPKLEQAYADCAMKKMVCPHRGLPLDGCETNNDVVTCPGHGLRWNIKTGLLVTVSNPSAPGPQESS